MELEGQRLLEKIVELPVSTWRYDWEPEGVVHVGPMAQDFAAAFALGDDDTKINSVDAFGVLVVAVQALYRRLQALEATAPDVQS